MEIQKIEDSLKGITIKFYVFEDENDSKIFLIKKIITIIEEL